jgi:hypothetical protein
MDVSCAFATSSDTPAYVEIAEELGYQRAWLYDSPAIYPDVWMVLSRCAERTSRIGLGPGVLVPSLRHPMVNAAAIANSRAKRLAGSRWRSARDSLDGWRWAPDRCRGGRSPTTSDA